MKLEQYYRVEIVALGAVAVLAAVLVWIELTAPEAGYMPALVATGWLIAAVFWFVQSIRRQLGIIISPRVRPWMLLTLSLLMFIVLWSESDELDTYELAQTLGFVSLLVLAVFLFFAAIVKYLRLVEEPD